jgi:hypothetical protein
LTQEWQAHGVTVSTNRTTSLQYINVAGAYSTGIAAYVRLSDMLNSKCSNGAIRRDVSYGYRTAGAVDDIMSRLVTIKESDQTVDATYTYLGAGTLVKESYQQASIAVNYDPSGNNSFSGFDRFGHVLNQIWKTYGGSTLDSYSYSYDRAGNRTQRNNATDAALTETCQSDALNRLTGWSVNGVQQKTWSLDSLGNNLSAGSYNAANEETPSSRSSGYDLAGNMTTLLSGNTAIYDPWNRLVEVDCLA